MRVILSPSISKAIKFEFLKGQGYSHWIQKLFLKEERTARFGEDIIELAPDLSRVLPNQHHLRSSRYVFPWRPLREISFTARLLLAPLRRTVPSAFSCRTIARGIRFQAAYPSRQCADTGYLCRPQRKATLCKRCIPAEFPRICSFFWISPRSNSD